MSVEMALAVPVLLLVLLAAVEVAAVARAQIEVVNAAREGARQAATSPDPARAVAAARAALGTAGETARIAVRRPHVVGEQAEVEVVMPYRLGGGLLGGATLRLGATAAMRVER